MTTPALAMRLLAAVLVVGFAIRCVIGLELLESPSVAWLELLAALLVGVYHDLWAFVLIARPAARDRPHTPRPAPAADTS